MQVSGSRRALAAYILNRVGSWLAQKLGQLGNIHRDPARLIFAEQFYNARPPVVCPVLLLTIG
jgi:hypothetical protein